MMLAFGISVLKKAKAAGRATSAPPFKYVSVSKPFCEYSNVLQEAYLEGQFFRNQPRLPGLITWEEPQKMKLLSFEFGLLRPGIIGFVAKGSARHEFDVKELAEHILKAYMDEAEKFKR